MLLYHRTVPGPDSSALELITSFANTPTAESGTDLLGTREQAAGWLRAMALLPEGAGLTGSEHSALLRLRDSMRDVLAAHADGREDADSAARLSRALADGRLVLTVGPASAVGLASAARASYSGVVASIAVAVAESAAAGTWLGLKTCSAPGCGQAFYDASGARHCPAHAQR
jgi:predicted RNA-binding Zn ribbon-like protein